MKLRGSIRWSGMLAGWLYLMLGEGRYARLGAVVFAACNLWPYEAKRRKVVRRVVTDLPLEEVVVRHCFSTGKVCYGHVNKDGSYTIEEVE